MTTAQDQQSRAEFEAYQRDTRKVDMDELSMNQHGDYDWEGFQSEWEIWQAARALPQGMEPAIEVTGCTSAGGGLNNSISRALPQGTKLYTAPQVQAMGRVPICHETVEMARAVQKKLKTLRKKDVPMDAYVLLTDAQYVIERLLGTATNPTGD